MTADDIKHRMAWLLQLATQDGRVQIGDDIRAEIAEIERLALRSLLYVSWIQCSDRLPQQAGPVLGYDQWDGPKFEGDVGYFLFADGKFYHDCPDGWRATGQMPSSPDDDPWQPVLTVTHWMPLPERPLSISNSESSR